MTKSLSANLIEKFVKNSGGVGKPKVANIGTPNNHTTGKKRRVIKNKKMSGDLPVKRQKMAQVDKPKSRERRKMVENKVTDAVLGAMMKFSGPKFGRQLYDRLKSERPDLYDELIQMYGGMLRKGAVTDRQQMGIMMNDPNAFRLAHELQDWIGNEMPPEWDDWAEKKSKKLGLSNESVVVENKVTDAVLGAMMKFSGPKFGRQLYDRLKSERPDLYDDLIKLYAKLLKQGAVTDRQQLAAMVGDSEAFNLAIELQRWIGDNLPDEFDDWAEKKSQKLGLTNESVVAEIHNDLTELATILGTELHISTKMVEAYPDDYDAYAHDQMYNDDEALAAEEQANEDMEDDVVHFLKKEGKEYIDEYKKFKNSERGQEDDAWYLEHLWGLVEAAKDVADQALAHDKFNLSLDKDVFKKIVTSYLEGAGVDKDDIEQAFDEDLGEDVSGTPNTLDAVTSVLADAGYQTAGGGFMGGQKIFKNQNGEIVTIIVNTFQPDKVIGWKTTGGKEGRSVAELQNALSRDKPRGGMFSRFRKPQTTENASGGAVGGGAIAGTANGRPKSQLFAGELEEDDSVGVRAEYVGRVLDMARKGGTSDMWRSLENTITRDNRLTHNDIAELQSAIHRYSPDEHAKADKVHSAPNSDIVNIPQDEEEFVRQLDAWMEPKYFLNWEEAAGDMEPIRIAIKKGMTPEEFGKSWAQATGMDTVDGDWD